MRHDGLRHFLGNYVDSNGRWDNKKQTVEEREHIAEGLSRQLMWRRMNTDLHSKDPKTKQTSYNTLKTLAFVTGLAFDDTTSTSVRDLKSFDHMSFLHNEGMNYVNMAEYKNSDIEIIHATGSEADEFGEG